MSKPLVVDLYCGLGGWAEGFLAEGYDVVGFDIERHDYGTGGYPGQLVLQDVLTLHGSQFKDATVIVASPPCQKYSYMAMPWSKAKALIKHYEASPENRAELTALFDACFRIQREASEAAGRRIPLIVENVRGAQRWVGRAKANYGSYYLWGDVGMVGRRVVAGPALEYGQGVSPVRGRKTPVGSWDLTRANYNPDHSWDADGQKQPGRNFHFPEKYGIPSPSFHGHADEPSVREAAVKLGGGKSWSDFGKPDYVPFGFNHENEKRVGTKTEGRSLSKGAARKFGSHNMGSGEQIRKELGLPNHNESDGVKGFTPHGEPLGKNVLGRMHGSKSPQRKAASAAIAKIPFPLASYIARAFKNR